MDKSCVIYCRVASRELADQEGSLTHQERTAREFAKKQGYHVAGVFIDASRSGANIAGRKGLQDALSYIQRNKHVTAFVVRDISALCRRASDTVNLTKFLQGQGVDLLSINEPIDLHNPEGEMMVGIIGAVNEFYSQIHKQKTIEGIKRAKLARKK